MQNKIENLVIDKLVMAGDLEGLYEYLLNHDEYKLPINTRKHYHPPCLVSWEVFERAIVLNQPYIVDWLLSSPAFKIDPNVLHNGLVPIVLAAKNGNIELIEILLKYKADVNKTYEGHTALMLAAACDELWGRGLKNEIAVSIIKLLLNHKADVNISNSNGYTALMITARTIWQGSRPIEMLMKAGADPNHVNHLGRTALDVAYGWQKKEKLMQLRKELFRSKHSSELIYIIDGQLYIKQEDLKGRGQEGEAAFYLCEDNREYLIKKDKDLATCVLEGSLQFIQDYLPGAHAGLWKSQFRDCINLAHCCVVDQYMADKKEIKEYKREVASIQPKVKDAKPWDVVLFGKKREPNHPVSQEFRNQAVILDHLAELSNVAVLSLAASIMAGMLCREESFHFAQYMVGMDKDDEIIKFIRIDLGASGRYGRARLEAKDFKLGTSDVYAKSGQFGKRYVDYLLNAPNVMIYVCLFWSEFDIDDIDKLVSDSKECFRLQINKVPGDLQQDILNKIYDIYTKKSSIKRNNQDITQQQLDDIMNSVLKACVMQMQEEGAAKINDLLNKVELERKNYKFSRKKLESGIIDEDDSVSGVYDIACLINKRIINLYRKQDSNLSAELSHSYQILAYMYGRISTGYLSGTPLVPANIIELLQIKIMLLQKLIKYKDHLLEALLQNGAQRKIILISEAIGRLFVSPVSDYSEIIDTLKPICKPRLMPLIVTELTEGEKLFRFLQKKLKTFAKLKFEMLTENISIKVLDFFGVKPELISDKLPLTFFPTSPDHSNLKHDSKEKPSSRQDTNEASQVEFAKVDFNIHGTHPI